MITTGWTAPDAGITAFLDEYDNRGATPDGDAAGLFAPDFLAVDPAQVHALSPAVLARALPARRRMFDEAGVGAIRRTDARQLRLDDRHLLVSVDWTADRATGRPLRLSSTFLVRVGPEGPRILVYLNHHDIAAMLAGQA